MPTNQNPLPSPVTYGNPQSAAPKGSEGAGSITDQLEQEKLRLEQEKLKLEIEEKRQAGRWSPQSAT